MNFGGSLIGPKISNEQITICYDLESHLSFAIASRVYKVKNISEKMLLDEWAAMLAPANTSVCKAHKYLNHDSTRILPF